MKRNLTESFTENDRLLVVESQREALRHRNEIGMKRYQHSLSGSTLHLRMQHFFLCNSNTGDHSSECMLAIVTNKTLFYSLTTSVCDTAVWILVPVALDSSCGIAKGCLIASFQRIHYCDRFYISFMDTYSLELKMSSIVINSN